ncbi:uncharacterized protein LOC134538162 [Bacillus rossius redtenbacheri]|uniref:uncharacterized protein LOC134538162 n=1 Tax=Bacillus rossius redtenbacheri TaxID=93214 RepID=UPI002FDDE196
MTFYLKPPRGAIPLHTLRTCVEERLELFRSLDDFGGCQKPQLNVACLLDGSALDRTAHYMLRVFSLVSPELGTFVTRSEGKLFALRLDGCTERDFLRAMGVARRHAAERASLLDDEAAVAFLRTLADVCGRLGERRAAAHVLDPAHHRGCSQLHLRVPFQMCLPLVRRREVDLCEGHALVPCGKWKELLSSLFETHWLLGSREMRGSGVVSDAMEDPRVAAMLREAERRVGASVSVARRAPGSALRACDVDAESAFFPPCARHLHGRLRATHRLPHEARRRYTLFLKAAGVPVDQALLFWREEYSRPRDGCSGCAHSWQRDARRYTYGIRHTYGLEGGRYDYGTPACHAIQRATLTPLSEEGCPFKHFEDSKLKKCLHENIACDVPTMNTILALRKRNKPTEACAAYLSACVHVLGNSSVLQKTDLPVNIHLEKPEDFYFFLKENALK